MSREHHRFEVTSEVGTRLRRLRLAAELTPFRTLDREKRELRSRTPKTAVGDGNAGLQILSPESEARSRDHPA
jgi:hypothetical protein